MKYDYDFFVIGAGSAGVRACRVAAGLGASVAVAEERYFGGTCVNVGCVPKKLFSYAAHYRDDFEDSAGFGWNLPEPAFNWQTLVQNKNREIQRLNGIYKTILDEHKVTVFRCRAQLADAHTVIVGTERVSARYILVATGGWPWIPPFPGHEHAISSNEVFFLERLPKSLVVLGGGYIAVEFASIFARLGSEVTLVYRGDALLRGFDSDVRHFLGTEIGRCLTLRLNEDITEITKKNNILKVNLKSGSQIECDTVLAATGRRPLTADLGLENTAIQLSDHGAIVVDKQFRTAEPSIYATGDVIQRITLTPVALAEAQLVARQLFDQTASAMDYDNIPSAVFCHPNVGTVGLSEDKAKSQGFAVETYVSKVRQLKHTLSGREEHSLLKLVVDSATDRVLGLHIVAPEAGELVQGFAVALNSGATKADFDRTIGIHPTLAEEFVTMRTPQ
ncbi:MAG: glutathione-disulfide reductase [Pseudohongiellaceae bacterium]